MKLRRWRSFCRIRQCPGGRRREEKNGKRSLMYSYIYVILNVLCIYFFITASYTPTSKSEKSKHIFYVGDPYISFM